MSFLNSIINNSKKFEDPFEHWELNKPLTNEALEEIANAATSPKVYQLYIHGDWDWTKDMLDRAKSAGYKAICITVDTASYSNRERPLLSRWVPMSQRTPPDPVWQASVTWDTIERIRQYVGLPLLVKGIGTGEDASIAIQHGVDVIWVSNHGGRQLDHGLGTLDVLPEVVESVDGKCEIVLDGGVQRGTDVIKALCLGANAVAIGKLQGLGLSAAGTEGIVRVLELLEIEMRTCLGLLGVTSNAELDASFLHPAPPVYMPSALNAFPFWNPRSPEY